VLHAQTNASSAFVELNNNLQTTNNEILKPSEVQIFKGTFFPSTPKHQPRIVHVSLQIHKS
jgi:hypothetical protein